MRTTRNEMMRLQKEAECWAAELEAHARTLRAAIRRNANAYEDLLDEMGAVNDAVGGVFEDRFGRAVLRTLSDADLCSDSSEIGNATHE